MSRKLLITIALLGTLAATACHRQVCPGVGSVQPAPTTTHQTV
jgi:hypothetical protein